MKPLQRRVAIRRPRRTFVVFCEGKRTEPEYLNALKRQPTVREVAAVDLRVEAGHGGSAPQALVSIALDARNRAIDEEAEIDEFWCVFDVEWPINHPGLLAALRKASNNGIQVAVSNPCFELWLVLHFQDHSAWLSTDEACRIRQTLDGSPGKGLNAGRYMPCIADAAIRAAQLDKRHLADGTKFPDNNPSSGMHQLISAIRAIPS
jgi:hypothetical protein